jgi:hypothetical protein
MKKKSSIGIISSTPDLLGLLGQHLLIENVEFVARERLEEADTICLDNSSSAFILVKASKDKSSIELEKPFNISNLYLVIQKMLNYGAYNTLTVGPFTLDCQNHIVVLQGQTVHLTEKETLLLYCLMYYYPNVVTKQQLWQEAWEHVPEVDSQTLLTHIYRLRRKLGKEADSIHTGEEGYFLKIKETP